MSVNDTEWLQAQNSVLGAALIEPDLVPKVIQQTRSADFSGVERAKSIAQELVKRGINEGRLICKGSGSSKPIADNSTAEGKKMNRRVEITILK